MGKKIYDPSTGLEFDPETGELSPVSPSNRNAGGTSKDSNSANDSLKKNEDGVYGIILLCIAVIIVVFVFWKQLLGSALILVCCGCIAHFSTHDRDSDDLGRWSAFGVAAIVGLWGSWIWWGYISGPQNSTESVALAPAPVPASVYLATLTECENVNVRAAPGTSSTVLFVLSCKEEVQTDNLRESVDSGRGTTIWTKIHSTKGAGWVNSKFVQIVTPKEK